MTNYMSDTNPPANEGSCDKLCTMFLRQLVSFGQVTIAGLEIIIK